MRRQHPKNRVERRMLTAINKIREACHMDRVITIPKTTDPISDLLLGRTKVIKNGDLYKFVFDSHRLAKRASNKLKITYSQINNKFYIDAPKSVVHYMERVY